MESKIQCAFLVKTFIKKKCRVLVITTALPPDLTQVQKELWCIQQKKLLLLGVTQAESDFYKNATQTDLDILNSAYGDTFLQTPVLLSSFDIFEIRLFIKNLDVRIDNLKRVVRGQNNIIISARSEDSLNLNFGEKIVRLFFIIKKGAETLTPLEYIAQIKVQVWDNHLAKLTNTNTLLDKVQFKKTYPNRSEHPLYTIFYSESGSLALDQHLASGRAFIVKAASSAIPGNGGNASYALPFLTEALINSSDANRLGLSKIVNLLMETLKKDIVLQDPGSGNKAYEVLENNVNTVIKEINTVADGTAFLSGGGAGATPVASTIVAKMTSVTYTQTTETPTIHLVIQISRVDRNSLFYAVSSLAAIGFAANATRSGANFPRLPGGPGGSGSILP